MAIAWCCFLQAEAYLSFSHPAPPYLGRSQPLHHSHVPGLNCDVQRRGPITRASSVNVCPRLHLVAQVEIESHA
jgi:hypothetical protein